MNVDTPGLQRLSDERSRTDFFKTQFRMRVKIAAQ
ncbi:hypothetical protein P353_15315 [Comamonas testosteroni]|uniref:Uncharacterized protein n=1 Tax=Comamonas testosteroni TaxID=285 RepID=A0A096HI62_COMTE|nr:hypothetical protein P353_15315 [Comamonas testosteroni]